MNVFKSNGYNTLIHSAIILSMEFAIRKIREGRIKKGYSQEYMGDRMGVAQVTYGQFENGKRRLTVENLVQIAIILEMPITYFFEYGEGEELPKNNSDDNSKLNLLERENNLLRKSLDDKEKIIQLLESKIY